MPSSSEFQELIDFCDIIDADGNIIVATDKRTTMYGVVGIRLRSRVNGNIIFFPACGYGNGSSWASFGLVGYYWSTSWSSDLMSLFLYFSASAVYPHNTTYRYSGFPIRPVFDPTSP